MPSLFSSTSNFQTSVLCSESLEVHMFKLTSSFCLGTASWGPGRSLEGRKGVKLGHFIHLARLLGYCWLVVSYPWRHPQIPPSVLFIQLYPLWVPPTSPSPLSFRQRGGNISQIIPSHWIPSPTSCPTIFLFQLNLFSRKGEGSEATEFNNPNFLP